MNLAKHLKFLILIFLSVIFLNSFGGKLPGADARKYPPNPEARVKKNIEEGRGFRLCDKIGCGVCVCVCVCFHSSRILHH